MRVTNSMLVNHFMNNLNTNMTKLDKIQSQLASGKKYAHISDDPVAVIYSREARYKLNRLEHYQMNVGSAQDWLLQVESGVMELNETMKNAYESCIDAATDIKSDSDRENVAKYIAQMRDHVLTTLNASFGDKYMYGGYNTTGNSGSGTITGPFALDASGNLCYNGCDLNDPANASMIAQLKNDVLSFNVGPGIDMKVTINGIDLVMFTTKDGQEKNLYNVLDDLYNTVLNGDNAGVVDSYISDLQDAQNHLLAKTAEIGGRTSRLDLLEARYDQDNINYFQMLSDAEDADMAEVIMNQKMAEAVYNAALAAGAQIIQPTLMDFLR